MAGYVEALLEILNRDLLVPQERGLELTESQKGGGEPIRLTNPGRAIGIHLDALGNHDAFPWLNVNVSGISRICDYAVVVESSAERGSLTSVLLLELKSRHPGGASGQVVNGFILMDWLLALARRHRKADGPLAFRGIVFAHGLHVRTRPKALESLFERPSDQYEDRRIFQLPRKRNYELSALLP